MVRMILEMVVIVMDMVMTIMILVMIMMKIDQKNYLVGPKIPATDD